MLLPFKDKIIYDGLLGRYNIFFGGGTRRRLQESYGVAKERLGIVTALPVQPEPLHLEDRSTRPDQSHLRMKSATLFKQSWK